MKTKRVISFYLKCLFFEIDVFQARVFRYQTCNFYDCKTYAMNSRHSTFRIEITDIVLRVFYKMPFKNTYLLKIKMHTMTNDNNKL